MKEIKFRGVLERSRRPNLWKFLPPSFLSPSRRHAALSIPVQQIV